MKKDNIIKAVFVLILLAIIVLVTIYIMNLNTVQTNSYTFYQYFNGKKIEYEGAIEIAKKDKNITQINIQNKNITLDSTPMYYKDTANKVIFPQDMAIVFPTNNGQINKINRFSTIEYANNSNVLEYANQTKTLEKAFIYDGQDLYFFLEETEIKLGQNIYHLTPLSYVIVTYKDNMEIYEKNTDTNTIVPLSGQQPIAQTKDYTINLAIDTLKYGEKEQILLKQIHNLLPI